MAAMSAPESIERPQTDEREGESAQESRAIGDITAALVDRHARSSNALFASLTHRAPDFTQTLLAVPLQTNGVLIPSQMGELQ
jgi:hypothetical protein